jgi:hypothetical protein
MPDRESPEQRYRQPHTRAAVTIEAEYLRGDITYQEYIAQIQKLPGYAQKRNTPSDERQR